MPRVEEAEAWPSFVRTALTAARALKVLAGSGGGHRHERSTLLEPVDLIAMGHPKALAPGGDAVASRAISTPATVASSWVRITTSWLPDA